MKQHFSLTLDLRIIHCIGIGILTISGCAGKHKHNILFFTKITLHFLAATLGRRLKALLSQVLVTRPRTTKYEAQVNWFIRETPLGKVPRFSFLYSTGTLMHFFGPYFTISCEKIISIWTWQFITKHVPQTFQTSNKSRKCLYDRWPWKKRLTIHSGKHPPLQNGHCPNHKLSYCTGCNRLSICL